jgi:mono/diheme cytochrome c family protein
MKWIAFYLSGLMFLLSMSIVWAHNGLGSATSDQVYPASVALAASSDPILDNAQTMITAGRQTFRFDTFGDEAFWGDQLQLHRAIEGANLGGVGPGVSPRTALSVGLKVDSDALPSTLVDQLKKGQVNLDDPATTLALLKLNAVVGLTGFFNDQGTLRAVGIQCAVCHSTVDDSLAPGIGHRLDGWANRDLNVGAIIALAPNLQPLADLLGTNQDTVRAVLNSWGPGKFDAELILDGKAFNPSQKTNGVETGVNVPGATLIPPAFGLAGVNLHTWTGWGSVTHWNAFVANLEMHGKGTFYDPRLNNAAQFPIAATAGFGNVRSTPDLITKRLAALHFYQLAIPAPTPPKSSFDQAAAARGRVVFDGKAKCATCHVPPLFTEPGWNMHTPAEIGIDDFQANRAPDQRYRTSPLKGLWTHQKGGFYHDGRFATLPDVVNHYNTFFGLGLTDREINDLVEYLKSL